MSSEEKKISFGDHLDELRTAIVKTIVVWSVLSIVAFGLKEQLFDLEPIS